MKISLFLISLGMMMTVRSKPDCQECKTIADGKWMGTYLLKEIDSKFCNDVDNRVDNCLYQRDGKDYCFRKGKYEIGDKCPGSGGDKCEETERCCLSGSVNGTPFTFSDEGIKPEDIRCDCSSICEYMSVIEDSTITVCAVSGEILDVINGSLSVESDNSFKCGNPNITYEVVVSPANETVLVGLVQGTALEQLEMSGLHTESIIPVTCCYYKVENGELLIENPTCINTFCGNGTTCKDICENKGHGSSERECSAGSAGATARPISNTTIAANITTPAPFFRAGSSSATTTGSAIIIASILEHETNVCLLSSTPPNLVKEEIRKRELVHATATQPTYNLGKCAFACDVEKDNACCWNAVCKKKCIFT